MGQTKHRILFLLLGVALALVVIFAVVFTPDGREFQLPEAVDSISPGHDATVQHQIDLIIDMAVGYEIELFVDGILIPRKEIVFSVSTGRHLWSPNSNSTFTEWTNGLHSVQVKYERMTGLADAGSFSWIFRVQ
mgnify:CR=1 FL=1|tara:strand:+ start:300 stop:701 length:402 start_codon:yes stop_codon:yes gene_type:complete